MKSSLWTVFALMLILMGTACSKEYKKYANWSRKGTTAQKDSAAFYYYNREDYDKAAFLFEDLRNVYRGGERAKDILYYYAMAKYNSSLYVVAAYYFEQYTKQYPSDARTEECTFRVGYCYYLQSAPYYLDQDFTRKTIDQMQLFLNAFPYSERSEEANKLIEEMREKLAKKEFESARLYYKLSNYKGAVTAFEVMMQEFPDSRYREEAQFLMFKSSVSLADISTERRKKNRYLDAIELYEKFIERYPNSTYLREAENLYAKARKNLGKLNADKASK